MKEWTSAAWMVGNLLFVFRVALLSLTIQATRVNSPLRTEYRREYSRVKVEFPPLHIHHTNYTYNATALKSRSLTPSTYPRPHHR